MSQPGNRPVPPLACPPVLRCGFRPFFLSGACWAVVVTALWLLCWRGALALPTQFDPLAWHRHEMLFGFLGAIVAGFALTAIANWTGRPPVAGPLLAFLVALWLAARCAVLVSTKTGALPAMALDVGFLAVLALVVTREIVAGRNRNYPLAGALLLLALAAGWDHAETLGWSAPLGRGWRLGFAVLLLLVALIGGRIIPAFTRNWLVKQGIDSHLPVQPGRFDAIALIVLAGAGAAWVIAPETRTSALLLLSAGVLQAARLARWSGLATRSDPLVFVLHAAFAWLPAGLLLLGASRFVPAVTGSAALHALGAGAMAAMVMAVMTRASLGHTGRALVAGRTTRAIYLLLFAGAALRVAAPLLPVDQLAAITLAGAAWAGAFVLFVLRYAAILVGPRPDGKP